MDDSNPLSSSDVGLHYRIYRRTPYSIRSQLSRPFHPYRVFSTRIDDILNPSDFDERIESMDRLNHYTSTYIGLIRQYHSQRDRLVQLCRSLTDVEKALLETSKKIEEEIQTTLSLTNHEEDSDDDDDYIPRTQLFNTDDHLLTLHLDDEPDITIIKREQQ